MPGEDYRIGKYEGEPIKLYFIPHPGHYEAIAPLKSRINPIKLMYLIKQISSVKKLPENIKEMEKLPFSCFEICNAFFMLEREVDSIKSSCRELQEPKNWDIKSVLRDQLINKIDEVSALIAQLKFGMDQLGLGYLALLKDVKGGFLCEDILKSLIEDALVIVKNELINLGKGPLSQLILAIKNIKSPNSTQHDYSSLKFTDSPVVQHNQYDYSDKPYRIELKL